MAILRARHLLAALLALAQADAAAQEAALPSALASKRLLLDATRAGDRVVAVGEWGHVVLSDDGGRSWRQARSVPTRSVLTGVSFADAREGWAVGHDAVVIHTGDGGESWELQHSAPELEAPLLSVWFRSREHGVALGAFGLLLETRDGGRTWRRGRAGGEGEDLHLNDVFGDPRSGTLFVAAETGTLYRSQDGTSWSKLELPYRGSLWGGLALRSGAVLVFGMRGRIFRSEDAGAHWREVESGTEHSLCGATETEDGRVVVVGLAGALLTSQDDGRHFAATTLPARRSHLAVTAGASETLLLFGDGGVEVLEDLPPATGAVAGDPPHAGAL